jgi:hypothetical protein
MATSILALVAYLLPLIIDGLKNYTERQKGADHDANIQSFRKAMGKGDRGALSGSLSSQHDRMLAALRGGRRR